MKCPECYEENVLTWRRYFASPFSRFRCSACNTRFKLKRPIWYWLLPLGLWSTILIGGLAIIYFIAGHCDYGIYSKPSLVALTVGSILLYAVIDKYVENGFSTIKI